MPIPDHKPDLETPCTPGAPPTGKDGLHLNVGHGDVTDYVAFMARYEELALKAGWVRANPGGRIGHYTHPDYPGWELVLDGHQDEEGGGWFSGLFSIDPVEQGR